MLIRTILHPTDYSELSHLAFGYALEMARVHHARLIILHAVETLGPENVTYEEATSRLQPASYRQRLWDELHLDLPPGLDVQVDCTLSEDDPVTAIVRTATERKCDLIVLGSHGRTGLKRLLEGSIAEEIMRASPCPVLVVKSPIHLRSGPYDPGTLLHPHSLSEPQ